MSALDILVCARNYLADPNKWGQGKLISGQKHCVGGAMFEWQEEPWDAWYRSLTGALNTFAQVIGVRPIGIFKWNDDPQRTHKQVLEALEKAIASERAKRTMPLFTTFTTEVPQKTPSESEHVYS